ncbi:MAG: hypothetical protein AAF351_16255, partial [Pseudomonadota bacterium]
SEPKDADTSPEPVAVKADAESGCAVAGELRTTLYGAIQVDIDWQAAALTCAGMPRPNGEGVRLRFAGQSDGRDLAIIVSMPEFDREATAKEFASTVTIIEEGSARFFNSPDLGNCWTEIETLEPIGDQQDDSSDAFVIGGGLYCVSPLAELNGDGSVTLNEMQFLGLLDWNAR